MKEIIKRLSWIFRNRMEDLSLAYKQLIKGNEP